ncbi:Thiol:disulfide oxidoreductase TlpA [hydrothermal vent metagenome]|uniref:Thiol:disulfide oxidoreductase TlpA n=1 Tax=hydrothermal vent metagenome TaxID=652676 RepID=A0A3B0XH91_9ZZZZ
MRMIYWVMFLSVTLFAEAFAVTPGEVQAGSYLREAKLNGINTGGNTFAYYKGKPLIINVWASWCGPCRAEMGSLERLAQRYNGKSFNLIGISIDDDGNAAADFLKQSNITFDNYLDSKLFLEYMLGANTIPLTVFVDANGRVLEKARGAYVWDSPKMLESIGKVFRIKLN